MVRMFAQAGAQAVELSGYDFARLKPGTGFISRSRRAGESGGARMLPLILVGGLRSVGDMEKALDAGIDLVAMCRPLVCQPDADRFGSGQETSPCVSCNRCFQNSRTTGFECAVRTE